MKTVFAFIYDLKNNMKLAFTLIIAKHNNYELYYKRSAQKDFYTILIHKR
jgi:hypothetical protein